MTYRYHLECVAEEIEGRIWPMIQVATRSERGEKLVYCSYEKTRNGWTMAKAMRDHLNACGVK